MGGTVFRTIRNTATFLSPLRTYVQCGTGYGIFQLPSMRGTLAWLCLPKGLGKLFWLGRILFFSPIKTRFERSSIEEERKWRRKKIKQRRMSTPQSYAKVFFFPLVFKFVPIFLSASPLGCWFPLALRQCKTKSLKGFAAVYPYCGHRTAQFYSIS